nr:PREDICTED: uncharacterized protein LOC106706128 [Latimeria chalumnae]|eukprot:XP_014352076.1 PREDICTED: uncharacterized protein LOC106706128 [Latimeria chalumnae]
MRLLLWVLPLSVAVAQVPYGPGETKYRPGDKLVYADVQYRHMILHTHLHGFLPRHLPGCYSITAATGMNHEIMWLLQQYQQKWNPQHNITHHTRQRRDLVSRLGAGGLANSGYNSWKLSKQGQQIDQLRSRALKGQADWSSYVGQLIDQQMAVVQHVNTMADIFFSVQAMQSNASAELFNGTKCLTASIILLGRLKAVLEDLDNGKMNPEIFTNHTWSKVTNPSCDERNSQTAKLEMCHTIQCGCVTEENVTMQCLGFPSDRDEYHFDIMVMFSNGSGPISFTQYGNVTNWNTPHCPKPLGDGLSCMTTESSWLKTGCRCVKWYESPCTSTNIKGYASFLQTSRIMPEAIFYDLVSGYINLTVSVFFPDPNYRLGSTVHATHLPWRMNGTVISFNRPAVRLFKPEGSSSSYQLSMELCNSGKDILVCQHGALEHTPYNTTDPILHVYDEPLGTQVIFVSPNEVCVSTTELTYQRGNESYNVTEHNFCLNLTQSFSIAGYHYNVIPNMTDNYYVEDFASEPWWHNWHLSFNWTHIQHTLNQIHHLDKRPLLQLKAKLTNLQRRLSGYLGDQSAW